MGNSFRVIITIIGLSVFFNGCSNSPKDTAAATVEGTVYLSKEDPVSKNAGILVYLAGTSFQARTDLNGNYKISQIPPGKYDLIAEKSGFQTQIVPGIELSESTNVKPKSPILERSDSTLTTTTTVNQKQFGAVSGSVFLENANLDNHGGVRIEIDGTPMVTVSSTEGRFQFPELAPGKYKFYFQKDGYVPFLSNEMEIKSGKNELADVALLLNNPVLPPSAPSIEGTMKASTATIAQSDTKDEDLPSTTPRSIFGKVTLIDAQDRIITDYTDVSVGINGTDMISEVDGTGHYRIDNLTSGVFTIVAAKPDSEIVETDVDVTRRRNTQVDIRILVGKPENSGTGGVSGLAIALTPDGQQAADSSGFTVSVLGTQFSASSDINGTFKIENIPSGTYTVNITKEGFKTASLEGMSIPNGSVQDIGTIRLEPYVDHPHVIATNPEMGSQNIKVGLDLIALIQFNTKMNADSVKQALTVSPDARFEVFMGNGSHANATDDTAVIVFSNKDENLPIRFNQNYLITVSTAAQDTNGVGLKENFSLRFKTELPGIISTYPSNGDNDVIVDDRHPLRIGFNVAVDPRSLQERFIKIKPNNGVRLNLAWTADNLTGWTLLTVGGQWQPNTFYTITINKGMRTKSGQYLGNTPYTFRFKTKGIDIIAPDSILVK